MVRFEPPVPMLFVYGSRKRFMFHTTAWAEALAARAGQPGARVRDGHWIMRQQPRELNQVIDAWLARLADARELFRSDHRIPSSAIRSASLWSYSKVAPLARAVCRIRRTHPPPSGTRTTRSRRPGELA
jgi:hypothetical protein